MKCDSQASFLSCTLTSPCLGRELKARVATKETNADKKKTKNKVPKAQSEISIKQQSMKP
jgi:uncharacterized protein (DUF736 family)